MSVLIYCKQEMKGYIASQLISFIDADAEKDAAVLRNLD
jgi:hypothetical protein